MSTVDWRVWTALDTAEPWEVAALSLSIDPDSFTVHQIRRANGYCGRSVVIADETIEAELDKRRRLLERYFASGEESGYLDLDCEFPYCDTQISVSAAATLFLSVGFDVPDKMGNGPEVAAKIKAVPKQPSSNTPSLGQASPPAPNNPPPKMREQEILIVDALRQLGYEVGSSRHNP